MNCDILRPHLNNDRLSVLLFGAEKSGVTYFSNN